MFQRPANNHLSVQQKGAIIALHQRNAPAVRIARDIGCHRNTVTKWINRYLNTFDVNRQIGSGRPRIATPDQDAQIFQTIRAKPFTSLQEIKGDNLYAPPPNLKIHSYIFYLDVCELPISRSTISRKLKGRGIHARVPCKKEFLTDMQREQRLAFANAYGDRNQDWWNSVIFSDDKTFG
jgi:transposase